MASAPVVEGVVEVVDPPAVVVVVEPDGSVVGVAPRNAERTAAAMVVVVGAPFLVRAVVTVVDAVGASVVGVPSAEIPSAPIVVEVVDVDVVVFVGSAGQSAVPGARLVATGPVEIAGPGGSASTSLAQTPSTS